MSLAPIECGIKIYKDANKRKTWAPNSVDDYYLGAPPEHYRAHRLFQRNQCRKKTAETIFFKHKYVTNSIVTHANRMIQVVKESCNAMSKKK